MQIDAKATETSGSPCDLACSIVPQVRINYCDLYGFLKFGFKERFFAVSKKYGLKNSYTNQQFSDAHTSGTNRYILKR